MIKSYASTAPGAECAPENELFLVFHLDDHSYAIAMENVDRVVRAFAAARQPEGPAGIYGLLNIHGVVIPLLNIRRIFGLPERELLCLDYFIITSGAAYACAISADSVPELMLCRQEELMAVGADERGKYIDRVIKAPRGLIMIFDPERLPCGEVKDNCQKAGQG